MTLCVLASQIPRQQVTVKHLRPRPTTSPAACGISHGEPTLNPQLQSWPLNGKCVSSGVR